MSHFSRDLKGIVFDELLPARQGTNWECSVYILLSLCFHYYFSVKCKKETEKKKINLTDFWREKCFIIKLILNPGHQVIDVLWSRTFDWLFNVGSISPMVFIPEGKKVTVWRWWCFFFLNEHNLLLHNHPRTETSEAHFLKSKKEV